MKNWTFVLLCASAPVWGAAIVSAADVATAPSTEAVAAQPPDATVPPTTAPATQPDVPQALDASVVPTTGPSTEPTTSPITATEPTTAPVATTEPTTSPVATTGPSTAPFATTGPSTLPTTLPVATTRPTTAPAYIAVSHILPAPYSILAERSIFQKGDHHAHPPEAPAAAQVATGSAPVPPTTAPTAEDSLVFEGATETGDHFLGFVEDRSIPKMLLVQNGDPIAHGKVAAVTLDTLDYLVDGNILHVEVGQNLKGELAPPPAPSSDDVASTGSTTAPSSGTPAPSAPTTPSANGTPPRAGPPSGNSPAGASGSKRLPGEDILHYLQRRRAEGN